MAKRHSLVSLFSTCHKTVSTSYPSGEALRTVVKAALGKQQSLFTKLLKYSKDSTKESFRDMYYRSITQNPEALFGWDSHAEWLPLLLHSKKVLGSIKVISVWNFTCSLCVCVTPRWAIARLPPTVQKHAKGWVRLKSHTKVLFAQQCSYFIFSCCFIKFQCNFWK